MFCCHFVLWLMQPCHPVSSSSHNIAVYHPQWRNGENFSFKWQRYAWRRHDILFQCYVYFLPVENSSNNEAISRIPTKMQPLIKLNLLLDFCKPSAMYLQQSPSRNRQLPLKMSKPSLHPCCQKPAWRPIRMCPPSWKWRVLLEGNCDSWWKQPPSFPQNVVLYTTDSIFKNLR